MQYNRPSHDHSCTAHSPSGTWCGYGALCASLPRIPRGRKLFCPAKTEGPDTQWDRTRCDKSDRKRGREWDELRTRQESRKKAAAERYSVLRTPMSCKCLAAMALVRICRAVSSWDRSRCMCLVSGTIGCNCIVGALGIAYLV